jgi:hypothetical protein
MANSYVYAEEWAVKLQARLNENNKWKDICHVEYTDGKVLHNPYLTDPTVQTGTRGTAYTMQDVVMTDESVDINTYKILPQVIDRADLAQSTFLKQMEMADRQGVLLNEAIETAVYADYAALTTFDNTEIGGAAGNITVSASNIDDIIRAMKRKIRVANGDNRLEENGGFIVWRPQDFELLEGFVQANGFQMADKALENGTAIGFNYMGITHYSSNKLTAGKVIGGVKKLYHLGICKSTYGQIVETVDPLNISGVGVISRVDFKGKAWNKVKPLLFNITVA